MDTCYKHMGWYGHDYLQWFGKKLPIKKHKFTLWESVNHLHLYLHKI
jgi:hypothetical protein